PADGEPPCCEGLVFGPRGGAPATAVMFPRMPVLWPPRRISGSSWRAGFGLAAIGLGEPRPHWQRPQLSQPQSCSLSLYRTFFPLPYMPHTYRFSRNVPILDYRLQF